MPPSQPLLSEHASLAKHLFIQGYPLWNPDPDLLPRARRSVGLRIGDVGTVDERGRFDFFFNILESLPGSDGSLPNFPQIQLDDVRCDGEDLLPRQVVSSPETPWEVDQLDVLEVGNITRRTTQYGATLSDDGAHIILPQGAQSFELGLHHRRIFEDHAKEHGADWLERFRDRLGWPRTNSIYLLTGFYKTCSWSIASFGMRTAANANPVHVHCTLLEVDERTIRESSVWQPAGRFKHKIGPPPDRQGQNNQTVFIRGITITPNSSGKGPSGRREGGLLGMLFPPTRLLDSLAGSSTSATETETPKSDIIIQHVPQISQASHPSEIINQYLLTKEPSARIAVTHDSQWIAMLKSFEVGQPWTVENLENRLEALVPVHYSIVMHNDTVYLSDKEHRSPTHTSVDQSHLPSDPASGTTSDEEPYAHGSFEDPRCIAEPYVFTDELEVTEGSLSHTMGLSPDWSPHSSVSSQVTSQPLQSVSSHPSGNPGSSHYTSSSHRHSSTKNSSIIITPNPGSWRNLDNSFPTRFGRVTELSDVEQDSALGTTDENPLALGSRSLHRFEQSGDLDDLQQAISLLEACVSSASVSDHGFITGLTNLGVALSYRFHCLGELSDLEEAISRHGDAVTLAPDGHPNKPGYLDNLGNAVRARFEHLGERSDLEEAISRHEDAIDLTANGHPDKPSYMNNLGNALRAGFEYFGDLNDLEEAIPWHKDAVISTPDGHPNKPGYLDNLGNALRARFEQLGKPVGDLEQAISRHRDAVDFTPNSHPDKPSYLNDLGNAFFTRFECLGELSDLDHAISKHRDAIDLIPDSHPDKPSCWSNLGNALRARFERLGEQSDLEQAISLYSRATCSSTGPTATRFRASQGWISCARDLRHHTLRAYSFAIGLLPQLAWIGHSRTYRYRELMRGADVARSAAAAALDSGLPETAVGWLEQGRSSIFGELFQLHSSYDELSSVYPDLARRLRQLSTALEHTSATRKKSSLPHSEQTRSAAHHVGESLDHEADRHHMLANERDKLLQAIRGLPGFERFLLHKEFSQLRASAHSGPVVILNAAESHCDALIVLAAADSVIHVPLSNFTLNQSKDLQNSLKGLLRHGEAISYDKGKGKHEQRGRISWGSILSILWNGVVKPVLDALRFSTPGDLSRIFWCPTGPFTFLPIHAAGIYGTKYSQPGHKVSDFVISSYVPTLSILATPPKPDAASSGNLRLLTVRPPPLDGPPLLGVDTELRYIKDVLQNSPYAQTTLLESSVGTVEEVLALMKEANWIHLTCYAIQDAANSAESGFLLANRCSLKLSDIIALSRPHGGLAYLSAGQMGRYNEDLPDEAIHIAAGILFAGYGGVIGAMWSINDNIASRVAKDVYEELFRAGTTPDYREAARALHNAVGHLRDSGASFMEWLPFIHVGL